MPARHRPAARPKIAPLVRSRTRESSAVLVARWKPGRTPRYDSGRSGRRTRRPSPGFSRSKRQMTGPRPFSWWPCGTDFRGQGDRATSRGSRAPIRRTAIHGTGRARGRATGQTALRMEASRSRPGCGPRPRQPDPHDCGAGRWHGAARVLGHTHATRWCAGAAKRADDDAHHHAGGRTGGAGAAVVGIGHCSARLDHPAHRRSVPGDHHRADNGRAGPDGRRLRLRLRRPTDRQRRRPAVAVHLRRRVQRDRRWTRAIGRSNRRPTGATTRGWNASRTARATCRCRGAP